MISEIEDFDSQGNTILTVKKTEEENYSFAFICFDCLLKE
jgi:hypothetical protein